MTPEQLALSLNAREKSGVWYPSSDAANELRRLAAENAALRKDAERLDWIESQAKAGKFEAAQSLLKTGYEIGLWPSMAVTVTGGTLRDSIDATMKETP